MSPRTRITTLNLGSQSLELAEFHAQPRGGLILRNYCSRDLFADPAQDGMRQTRITTALREMQGELQIKGGPVNYTVAEELIFTRFVNLPPVDTEKIERIVFFEAQQNVPFPIDEVIWDYQVVGRGPDEQIQVILAAMKADLLEEINCAVEAAGLRTSIVELATMALYNAFRHNYPGLSGCSLLIDIGARTTNLLFVEPERIFTRSVPIGGSTATSAIAKEFNEPFVAAEMRKKRDGCTALARSGSEPIEDDAVRVSRIVRNTMMRLHAELLRSISHYCAQQQGHPPERVFLSGGGASTPFVDEFFGEKLQLPAELLNPLRNVAISESASVDAILRSAHLLVEPVGLALRAVTECPMKLNLRPRSVVCRQEANKRRPFLIGAAALFLFGLLGCGMFYARTAQFIRQRTEGVQQRIDKLRVIEAALDQLHQQSAALESLAEPLVAAIEDRRFWAEAIEDLNARLPQENIWVTELAGTSGGKALDVLDLPKVRPEAVTGGGSRPPSSGSAGAEAKMDGLLVRGLYLYNPRQQEVVVDYFRNLIGSPLFSIETKNQARVIKPTTPTNTEWAFPYELHLDLRKPVKLP